MMAVTFLVSCSFAGTPPAAVQKSFEQKFPNAKDVSWGKEKKQEWEAEFSLDGKKLSANFMSDGAWVETEREISASEFPKAVSEAISKTYPGWKIEKAETTETPKNGIIYEADLKSGMQKKKVAFKEDGSVVQE